MVEQFSHVELEFERLEFHSSKFEHGKREKEKKRRKRRSESKEEEEDNLEKTGSEEDERSSMTTKNALVGSSMTAVASKQRVVEMSIG